jgi:hypothetical protein
MWVREKGELQAQARRPAERRSVAAGMREENHARAQRNQAAKRAQALRAPAMNSPTEPHRAQVPQ